MKIVYMFNKNPYAAIMAAYVHLKLDFPKDIKYIKNDYREGYFYYLGIDKELNEVYLLYSSKNRIILKNLLKGFADLYEEEVLVIDSEKI